ncbi:MAG: hypothetical protein ACRCX8_16700 [Sarcina sp.]
MRTNVITTAGQAYLAEVISNNKTIRISNVKVGKGSINSVDEAKSLTDLKSLTKTLGVQEISKVQHDILVKTHLNNIGVTTGYSMREVGIYVLDDNSNEILFWYMNYDEQNNYVQTEDLGIIRTDLVYRLVFSSEDIKVENVSVTDFFATKEYLDQKVIEIANNLEGITETHREEFHSDNIIHKLNYNNKTETVNGYNIITDIEIAENSKYILNIYGNVSTLTLPINTSIVFEIKDNTVINYGAVHYGVNLGEIDISFENNSSIKLHLNKNDYPINLNIFLITENPRTKEFIKRKWSITTSPDSKPNKIIIPFKSVIDGLNVSWENLSNKPSVFPPDIHNHDGSYFTKTESNNNFKKRLPKTRDFGNPSAPITTAQFIEMLKGFGAFEQEYWVGKGSWSYAGNSYITDTGVGNIHLAGCVVEAFGGTGDITIRITAPTTSTQGGDKNEFIYINHGNDYAPGWRKNWNSSNFDPNSKLNTSSKAVDSGLLNGVANSTLATPNTIGHRDSAGDIHMRLLRSEYPFQSDIYGGIAFRGASGAGSDNYVRFCSNPTAVRNWLGGNHRGKCDLLWSGGHYMDGGAELQLGGINFDNYQIIMMYVVCDNSDAVGGQLAGQLTCPTAQYGAPSYDWEDITGSDWCGAYLIDNWRIKPTAGSGVWIRRVYGIR